MKRRNLLIQVSSIAQFLILFFCINLRKCHSRILVIRYCHVCYGNIFYIRLKRKLCVWTGNASEDSIDVTNEEPLTPQRSGCTQLPPVLPSLYSPASAETVYETSARLLFMAVKWAKNLPSFAGLPFRDQVTIAPSSSNAIHLYLNMYTFLINLI